MSTASGRPVASADLDVLIGCLAVIEGELLSGQVSDELRGRLRGRFMDAGLLSEEDDRALRQAINDLNHRLRYALGEYDKPQPPRPVP